MTIWLAFLVSCGITCATHYEVFDSLAKCEVRVAHWNGSGFLVGRAGYCSMRDRLSQEDVEVYRKSGDQP